MKTKMPQAAFVVTRKGKEFDTVYFDADLTAAQVRGSLIRHDGYPQDIEVERAS